MRLRIERRLLVVGLLLASSFAFAEDTSMDLSYATYVDQAGRVKVIVGSHITAIEHKEDFLPFQVAVGVIAEGPELLFSPESFTLIDAAGKSHAAASLDQMAKQSGLKFHVQHLSRTTLPLPIGGEFGTGRAVGSLMYPVQKGQGTYGVHLNRNNFLSDVIYFPNAGDAALEGVLTLRVQTEGMEQPTSVRFEIPGKHKKHKHTKNG